MKVNALSAGSYSSSGCVLVEDCFSSGRVVLGASSVVGTMGFDSEERRWSFGVAAEGIGCGGDSSGNEIGSRHSEDF